MLTGRTCNCCGITSWHPVDVEQGYCGLCHAWTDGLVVQTTAPREIFRTTPIKPCPHTDRAQGVEPE